MDTSNVKEFTELICQHYSRAKRNNDFYDEELKLRIELHKRKIKFNSARDILIKELFKKWPIISSQR